MSAQATVVIPVFNAAITLIDTIDSVRAQTLPELKIVVVDDGSTDGSLALAQRVAASDSRLHVVSRPHLNAGAARNYGLVLAESTYVMFFDADDLMLPYCLETAVQEMERSAADVCIVGAGIFRTANEVAPSWSQVPSGSAFVTAEGVERTFQSTTTSVWNKLYRRQLLVEHDIRFQKIERTNDLVFGALAMACADTFIRVPDTLVWYRTGRSDSLQATVHNSVVDPLRALVRLKLELQERGLQTKYYSSFAVHVVNIIVYAYGRIGSGEAKEEFRIGLDEWAAEMLGMERVLKEVARQNCAIPQPELFVAWT